MQEQFGKSDLKSVVKEHKKQSLSARKRLEESLDKIEFRWNTESKDIKRITFDLRQTAKLTRDNLHNVELDRHKALKEATKEPLPI